ncbi:MAG TPA: acyltransferase [Terriglobales bacterium]|jgi:acetyltransferase-like isoleucine patch superfamily enzyme
MSNHGGKQTGGGPAAGTTGGRSATRVSRWLAKTLAHGLALLLAFPLALLAGFGHFDEAFATLAQLVALLPGLPGCYVRIAFYAMTLQGCPLEARVTFGSFFTSRDVVLSRGVYIGPYAVFGHCRIGERTQIASHVQVLSGKNQHGRDAQGRMLAAEGQRFATLEIGRDCWIGSGAIIMADIGDGCTIGAGAVVTRPVPAGVTAVGNPARPLRPAAAASGAPQPEI